MRILIIAAALITAVSAQAQDVSDEVLVRKYNITAEDFNNRQGFEKVYNALKVEIGYGAPTIHCSQPGYCLRVWSGEGAFKGDLVAEDPEHLEYRYFCAFSQAYKVQTCVSVTGRVNQSRWDPATQTFGEGKTIRTMWPK
jgi:hypothetical protein